MDEIQGKMTGEKKKRRIIKRIFKWIGLGLLVAPIFAALIYDAPWKVLALLLILLAAHTILPKAAIKWFWLSVAAVVVILIIWVSCLKTMRVGDPIHLIKN
jgi:FtsH-binding integral membrane protein